MVLCFNVNFHIVKNVTKITTYVQRCTLLTLSLSDTNKDVIR
jgi:hypothetical protein